MDMDQESMMRELFELREETKLLQEEKEHLYHDRELAGELGKTLLDQNKELEEKVEEINAEYTTAVSKMEELKQDNHILRTRLEASVRTKDFHLYEIENVKERLQKQLEDEKKSLQIASEKRVQELRKSIDSLQSEMDKHVLVENQLQEKIVQQEEMIENTRTYAKSLQAAQGLENEVEEQRMECAELQIERDSLLVVVNDIKNIQGQLEFDNKALKQRLESLDEEMQEKSRQAQTWYSHLQEARMEAGEFKAELDMVKAEEANRNHKNKGNSLFGEVEDRRLELERKYVGMTTQHECLVKSYTVTKQHLHKLKNQLAALLQVRGNHADTSQMQRLRQALARKEGEVKMLNEKMNYMEKHQDENAISSRLKDFHDAFSDFGDKKDYVNFLELQLNDSKKKISELKKELQTKTFLQLSENDRLRHTEVQLHNAESSLEKLNGENMRLKLRFEDLKMKLQTELKNREAATHDKAKDSTHALKRVNTAMRKTKSASVINSRVPANVPPCTPLENKPPVPKLPKMTPRDPPKETLVVPRSTAYARPVQKVTPMLSAKKKSPDVPQGANVLSESLASEIEESIRAEGHGAAQAEGRDIGFGSLPPRRNRTRVQFAVSQHDGSYSGETSQVRDGEVKEDSSPEDNITSMTRSAAQSGPRKMNNAVGRVRGQRDEPVVIHVSKGGTKNECPQQ